MASTPPRFCHNRAAFSATSGLEAVAAGLNAVKHGQSDAAMADPLFKSPDRVRDYRLGHSEMGAVTFARGVAAWGEAFGGPLLALAGYRLARLEGGGDTGALPVSGLLHKLIAANADGYICDRELLDMAGDVVAAGAVIDTLRSRLADLKAGVR